MEFFVSCGKGLEYLLVDELLALGCSKATATMAGANAEGSLADAQRAVLWSRVASRVLWPLTDFDCPDEDALYAGAAAVPWPEHLSSDMTVAVDAHVSGDAITHARYAAQRTKDAVVDVMRDATGERPDVDLEAPDLRLNLVVRKGRAIVSVDLGGGPLHRRGWRQKQGEAPLKETLACAVLLRGGWPQLHAEGGWLLDPMCGSGTLLIEGALMAADVAPGLQRYSQRVPSRWRGFDNVAWAQLIEDARTREIAGRATLQPVFIGCDLDPHAIRAARENAVMAGLAGLIQFDVCDIQALPQQAASRGLVVCNPPYDARLAADPSFYRALGDALRRAVPDWRASLLCGDAELAFATGLRARKKYQLFNGALECSLVVCDPVAPPRRAGDDAARALSEGAQMVANRLRKNLRKLKSWREREQVSCFRAYDADLPEYAAAIDVYVAADDPTQTWLHVQEYAAPADIPEALARKRINDVLAAARDVFAVSKERVSLKTRRRDKGGSKYADVGMAKRNHDKPLVVREGSVRLRVELFGHLDTGLFLDHRPLRLRIAEEARDTRFLNLFGYTGAATVHAAMGTARATTTVDLSATYLQWCADNLQENGIGGPKHRLVQADAVEWLASDRGQYDLVFCDPPTFSNSKRAGDFDVQASHVALLRAAMARLAPDGALYFSNNFRRFKLDVESVAEFADCQEISADTIPPDFARNPRIHRCWRLQHL